MGDLLNVGADCVELILQCMCQRDALALARTHPALNDIVHDASPESEARRVASLSDRRDAIHAMSVYYIQHRRPLLRTSKFPWRFDVKISKSGARDVLEHAYFPSAEARLSFGAACVPYVYRDIGSFYVVFGRQSPDQIATPSRRRLLFGNTLIDYARHPRSMSVTNAFCIPVAQHNHGLQDWKQKHLHLDPCSDKSLTRVGNRELPSAHKSLIPYVAAAIEAHVCTSSDVTDYGQDAFEDIVSAFVCDALVTHDCAAMRRRFAMILGSVCIVTPAALLYRHAIAEKWDRTPAWWRTLGEICDAIAPGDARATARRTIAWWWLSTRAERLPREIRDAWLGPAWAALDSNVTLAEQVIARFAIDRFPLDLIDEWRKRPCLRALFPLCTVLGSTLHGVGRDSHEKRWNITVEFDFVRFFSLAKLASLSGRTLEYARAIANFARRAYVVRGQPAPELRDPPPRAVVARTPAEYVLWFADLAAAVAAAARAPLLRATLATAASMTFAEVRGAAERHGDHWACAIASARTHEPLSAESDEPLALLVARSLCGTRACPFRTGAQFDALRAMVCGVGAIAKRVTATRHALPSKKRVAAAHRDAARAFLDACTSSVTRVPAPEHPVCRRDAHAAAVRKSAALRERMPKARASK